MTIKEIKIQYALGTLTDEMKLKLACNKRTSKKALTILSTDKYWYIRHWVAHHPSTPKEVLTILSTDKNSGVRSCVAQNPNTPKEVLTILSTDKNRAIRSWVAKNPNTPKEIRNNYAVNTRKYSYMSEINKQPENQYTRGPIIKRAAGPTFPIYDQGDVDLDGKDPEYIHTFVDGGGNCGPASLGVVVVVEGIIIMTFGAYLGDNLTNNIAELQAIWKGLRLVKHLWKPVRIYSDSSYSINSICGVFHGRKNRDIIDPMIEYIKQYPLPVEFVKVKGHSNLQYNEMADGIASTLLSQGKDFKHKKKKSKKSPKETKK